MNTITVESIHDVSVDRITSPLCNRVNPLGKSGVPLPNVIQKRIVDFLRNKEAQGISLTVTYGDSDAVWERFKIDINFSVSNILNNEVEQMKKKIKNDLYHQLFTVMDLFPIHSTHNYYIQEQDEVIE